MQGVGNDFVVVDTDTPGFDNRPDRLARRVCDRNFGIGADGLLLLTRIGGPGPIPPELAGRPEFARHAKDAPFASFAFRMFNPDGTEDMCGNGLRCAGLWALRHGWLEAPSFAVLTKDGLRSIRIISVDGDIHNDGHKRHSATLGVDMGPPRFAPGDIPFTGSTGECVCNFPLTVADRVFTMTTVNTGSTHTVIFGPPPTDDDFHHYSPLIEEHPYFPERTSVLWSTVSEGSTPLRVDCRIWERGAGETLGCGTGACAVAVAAREVGLAQPGQVVQVKSRGGTLAIGWGGRGTSVDMIGPAAIVFEGELARE